MGGVDGNTQEYANVHAALKSWGAWRGRSGLLERKVDRIFTPPDRDIIWTKCDMCHGSGADPEPGPLPVLTVVRCPKCHGDGGWHDTVVLVDPANIKGRDVMLVLTPPPAIFEEINALVDRMTPKSRAVILSRYVFCGPGSTGADRLRRANLMLEACGQKRIAKPMYAFQLTVAKRMIAEETGLPFSSGLQN